MSHGLRISQSIVIKVSSVDLDYPGSMELEVILVLCEELVSPFVEDLQFVLDCILELRVAADVRYEPGAHQLHRRTEALEVLLDRKGHIQIPFIDQSVNSL